MIVILGSGKLKWREEDEVKSADLRRGDVHRLEEGTIFLIQSNLDTDTDRQKLRIHAIFPNSDKYINVRVTTASSIPLFHILYYISCSTLLVIN